MISDGIIYRQKFATKPESSKSRNFSTSRNRSRVSFAGKMRTFVISFQDRLINLSRRMKTQPSFAENRGVKNFFKKHFCKTKKFHVSNQNEEPLNYNKNETSQTLPVRNIDINKMTKLQIDGEIKALEIFGINNSNNFNNYEKGKKRFQILKNKKEELEKEEKGEFLEICKNPIKNMQNLQIIDELSQLNAKGVFDPKSKFSNRAEVEKRANDLISNLPEGEKLNFKLNLEVPVFRAIVHLLNSGVLRQSDNSPNKQEYNRLIDELPENIRNSYLKTSSTNNLETCLSFFNKFSSPTVNVKQGISF